MLFNEITASSLVKVDMQGNVVESGTTNFNINTQGFLLHSAIHASRPDLKCVIHIKTPSVLAVSFLPLRRLIHLFLIAYYFFLYFGSGVLVKVWTAPSLS